MIKVTTTMTTRVTTMITTIAPSLPQFSMAEIYIGSSWKGSKVMAMIAKTTMTTKETTRITMQVGIILELSHELPKKFSAI